MALLRTGNMINPLGQQGGLLGQGGSNQQTNEFGQAITGILTEGLQDYTDAQRLYEAQKAATPQLMTVEQSSRTPTPQFGAILQNLDQLKAAEDATRLASLGGGGSLNAKLYRDTQTNRMVNAVYSPAIRNWVDPVTNNPMVPPRYVATTAGMETIGIATENQFGKLKKSLDENEITLKKYADYTKNVGGSGVGLERLANSMTTHFKTLLSTNADKLKLSEQEIAQRLAQGQLQGLIGNSRLEIVGGGVMTEQDALRIIQALGGDVNALQNPEIVKQVMRNIFNDKYKIYQGDLDRYNRNVESRYGQLGYEPRKAIEIPDIFSDSESNNIQQGVSGGSGLKRTIITTEQMQKGSKQK